MKRTNSAKWLEKQSRWQINVQKDGKRRSFTSATPGRTGQREANAKADAWLDDGIEKSSTRISDLTDEYLKSVEIRTSKSNYKKEELHIRLYVIPIIGYKKISSINEQDLQDIIDNAYKYKDSNGEIAYHSKKTLENIRATVNSFIKFCRKKKVTTLFPESLTIPAGARYKTKVILQPYDLEVLFSKDTTKRNNKWIFDKNIYAYRFQVLTGLRPGELRGLTMQSINGRYLRVTRSINIFNEETQGKNGNALRGFELSDIAFEVLQKQINSFDTSETIFNIVSTDAYRKQWQAYCRSNNIQVTSLYELRHTFVSIAKQLPEGQVKALIGHSKNMDTFGVYGHEMSGESKATAMAVNAIFERLVK